VEVPNLLGLRLDQARGSVESAGLEFGGVSGDPAGLVSDQSPRAGADVPRGTVVSVTLAPSSPRLVRVPNLVGQTLDGVPGRLARHGLELGLVTGDGDVVRSQNPEAGSRARQGSAVNVSVERGVPPRQLVRAPDLVGDTVTDARAALGARGLVLGETLDDDGEIASQQPPAGTLVPVGTTVTVALEHGPRWAAIVVVLAVVLGAAAAAAVAGYRLLRRRRDRRWVHRHLRLAPEAGHRRAEVTQPGGDASPPTQVVRIEPHPVHGTHDLEETPR
jgi:hypothetical protein